MYISQITVDRIKKIREEKGISAAELNKICELSKNTVSTSANSKNGLSAKILFDISKFLDCSVDYLLGRTDNPEIRTDGSINIGNIGNNSNNNNHIQVSPETETQQEISSILSHLSFRERTELMTLIYKYFDEHNKGV